MLNDATGSTGKSVGKSHFPGDGIKTESETQHSKVVMACVT